MSGTEALAVWDMGLASGMSKQVLCSPFSRDCTGVI